VNTNCDRSWGLLKHVMQGSFSLSGFCSLFHYRKGISGSALPYRRSVPTVCALCGLLKLLNQLIYLLNRHWNSTRKTTSIYKASLQRQRLQLIIIDYKHFSAPLHSFNNILEPISLRENEVRTGCTVYVVFVVFYTCRNCILYNLLHTMCMGYSV